MTAKDYINCADAIARLPVSESALNQIIISFSLKFSESYKNFNNKTFKSYILERADIARRDRKRSSEPLEIKYIE